MRHFSATFGVASPTFGLLGPASAITHSTSPLVLSTTPAVNTFVKAVRSFVAAAALSMVASVASAATSLGTLIPGGNPSSAPIFNFHSGGIANFLDEFTFSVSSLAAVGSSATSVQLQVIPGVSSGVNLQSMYLYYQGAGAPLASATISASSCGVGCSFQIASLSYATLLSGPSNWYSIKVAGDTLGFSSGSYGGTVEVTAVPEPHEWAMMLAGLGIVGTIAARRRKAVATT